MHYCKIFYKNIYTTDTSQLRKRIHIKEGSKIQDNKTRSIEDLLNSLLTQRLFEGRNLERDRILCQINSFLGEHTYKEYYYEVDLRIMNNPELIVSNECLRYTDKDGLVTYFVRTIDPSIFLKIDCAGKKYIADMLVLLREFMMKIEQHEEKEFRGDNQKTNANCSTISKLTNYFFPYYFYEMNFYLEQFRNPQEMKKFNVKDFNIHSEGFKINVDNMEYGFHRSYHTFKTFQLEGWFEMPRLFDRALSGIENIHCQQEFKNNLRKLVNLNRLVFKKSYEYVHRQEAKEIESWGGCS